MKLNFQFEFELGEIYMNFLLSVLTISFMPGSNLFSPLSGPMDHAYGFYWFQSRSSLLLFVCAIYMPSDASHRLIDL